MTASLSQEYDNAVMSTKQEQETLKGQVLPGFLLVATSLHAADVRKKINPVKLLNKDNLRALLLDTSKDGEGRESLYMCAK